MKWLRRFYIKFAFNRAHRNTGMNGYFRTGPYEGDG